MEAAAAEDRATWLWNPWMFVEDESGTLAFLASKELNKVYVQIDQEMPADAYRSFIAEAGVQGIQIYALDGAPNWVSRKGYVQQDRLMTWLQHYQAGSASAEKFAGIHLDVEPYLYSDWASNQAATVKSYQALLSRAADNAAALSLPIEVDMAFWFDEISYKNQFGIGILAEWVIAATDSVTIMAYRDSAALIGEFARNEVAFAGKHGKSLVIGVETGQTAEGAYLSFFEEGEAYMNKQLSLVQQQYNGTASYNGIAVHHVGSWMTMKP
ncbi:amidase [Planococcus lenghuensis]|uniref:amidase n=1 Tax=Planococcus lenghuensis TaxID=2213202 RepID=UPI001E575E3B|nr:amidase [Planococcus lenghuensis]